MLNRTYKTVWNSATRTYVAASEMTRSRGAKGASACTTLMAAGGGLLSALAFSLPAGAAECESPAQYCSSAAEALAAQTGDGVTPPANDAATPAELTAAINNASVFASNPIVAPATQPAVVASSLAAMPAPLASAPVTDYIAVSPNVVGGTSTSTTSSLNAMAIGPAAAASGINALTVGAGSGAAKDGTTAVGSGAFAVSANATVIGAYSSVAANADNSVSIGYSSRSSKINATSIGSFASAAANGAVAIGYKTFIPSSGADSVVLGSYSSATATGSVALGTGAVADRVNVVSVGNLAQGRQIAYVAAGTLPTDAANVGQLSGVTGALGGGAFIDPANGAVVAPVYTIGGATYNDVGAALAAVASGSAVESADSLRYDTANHDVATLGNPGMPVKLTNVADAALNAESSDAVTGAQLYGTNQAVAQNTADITNISNGSAGLLRQNPTSRDLTVAKDTAGKRVDFTGTAGPRELLGVAAGTTASSAINLGQLSPAVASLGGGATVSASGSVTGPTYRVQAGTQTTVGGALSSLDTGLTSLETRINSGTVGLVTHNPSTRDILVGAAMFGTRVDFAGASGTRVLDGVAAGAVNDASSEAVNGAQLQANTASTAAALGGGARVAADGTVTRPVYDIGGKTYGDVGAALAAVVSGSTEAGADAVRYDSAEHASVTLGGTAPVQVTNVRAATLDAASLDAVNGAQLYKTNQAVARNTDGITNLGQRVTDNTTNITHLDARTTTIEGNVSHIANQITNGELGLLRQDQESRDLTVAKDTDGARVDFGGTAGSRELIGIAAGTTDTSAINLGQFKPMVTALGGGAQINADGSVTGPTYQVQGATQTTVGDALGSLDTSLTTLRQNMETGGIGIVTQDSLSRVINVGATTDGNLIDMAGTAGNRVVTGVARGAVSASSNDAVNGSQLHAQAASTAVALGGGATVNEDGSVTAPSYSVGGAVVSNVGSAITNLDGRVTQNSSDIMNLQTSVGSISGTVANAVQYDSSAHDKVTLGGTAADAQKVQLTNLKDGDISATSSDAVTGAQLWSTNQRIGNLDQTVRNSQQNGSAYLATNSSGNAAQAIGNGSAAIGGGAIASAPNAVAIGEGSVADQTNTVSIGSAGNERRITNVAAGQAPTDAVNMQQFQGSMSDMARNAYSGTASAIALGMVPEVDANKNLAVGVGTAGYKGYQAVAVGLSARVTQSLKLKLGAGISSAATTVGAGAAYQW